MQKISVAHLTSAHARNDTRIFLKQCRGLASNGYDVSLIVADGSGDEVVDGVTVLDVGAASGRLSRMFGASRRVYRKAVELNADIYHLHDPELIPFGLRLRRTGRTVIYDAHEDVPKQMLGKPYLGPRRLQALARAYASFERYAARRLDGIVAATPAIGDKFSRLNEHTAVVNNYPLIDELYTNDSWNRKNDTVCYVGGISAARGIREMVAAMDNVSSPARLLLAGMFFGPDLESEVESIPGWARTNALGFVGRDRLRSVLDESVAGLVTLHPTPNHLESHPIKMFEYMAAGIPVIASDFPLWRSIIEGAECGYCVDPLDPAAIAECIDRLVTDKDEARRLGENGRRAIIERYNWANEEKALLEFYASVSRDSSLP